MRPVVLYFILICYLILKHILSSVVFCFILYFYGLGIYFYKTSIFFIEKVKIDVYLVDASKSNLCLRTIFYTQK